jgi:hypothetical protein
MGVGTELTEDDKLECWDEFIEGVDAAGMDFENCDGGRADDAELEGVVA